jgi:hypothetical protein
VSTPLRSKSSRVDKVTITGGGRMLRSDSNSHTISHVRSYSCGEAPAAVAIFSSLEDDDAASLYFVRRWVVRAQYDILISASPARMLPLNTFMSWRICIIWSPNVDREFFVCSILYRSRSLSISATFLLRFQSSKIAPSDCSCLLLTLELESLLDVDAWLCPVEGCDVIAAIVSVAWPCTPLHLSPCITLWLWLLEELCTNLASNSRVELREVIGPKGWLCCEWDMPHYTNCHRR